jgi:hypothetical protein
VGLTGASGREPYERLQFVSIDVRLAVQGLTKGLELASADIPEEGGPVNAELLGGLLNRDQVHELNLMCRSCPNLARRGQRTSTGGSTGLRRSRMPHRCEHPRYTSRHAFPCPDWSAQIRCNASRLGHRDRRRV